MNLVVVWYFELPLNISTKTHLNKIITSGLIPQYRRLVKIWYNYHSLEILQLGSIPYTNHCAHGWTNPPPRHSGITCRITYLLDFQFNLTLKYRHQLYLCWKLLEILEVCIWVIRKIIKHKPISIISCKMVITTRKYTYK